MPTNTAATLVQLVDVQRRIESMREARNELIREAVKGGAGVRGTARLIGLSAAQVSRIASQERL